MKCWDVIFENPVENLVFDELLLKWAESGEGGECLRFWESEEDFVVLGRIGKLEEDVNLAPIALQSNQSKNVEPEALPRVPRGATGARAAEAEGAEFENKIPVYRRASGGGTVVQGRGCLNFTFVFSFRSAFYIKA